MTTNIPQCKAIPGRVTSYRHREPWASVYRQALKQHWIAKEAIQSYHFGIEDDPIGVRGVQAFIKLNQLMGRMRSRKKLAELAELRYDISWEYMYHPRYQEWTKCMYPRR